MTTRTITIAHTAAATATGARWDAQSIILHHSPDTSVRLDGVDLA